MFLTFIISNLNEWGVHTGTSVSSVCCLLVQELKEGAVCVHVFTGPTDSLIIHLFTSPTDSSIITFTSLLSVISHLHGADRVLASCTQNLSELGILPSWSGGVAHGRQSIWCEGIKCRVVASHHGSWLMPSKTRTPTRGKKQRYTPVVRSSTG